MASTVTNYSNQINTNYPVPGMDNDTQGFRDNFSRIKSALGTLGQEITDIQSSSVNLSATNNFGDNIIRQAAFQDCSQKVEDLTTINTSTFAIDYTQGSYQVCELSPGLTVNFEIDNWPPATQCGVIRVQITPTSTASVTINFTDAIFPDGVVSPATYTNVTRVVWELWSPDSGTTVFAKEIFKK